MATKTSTSKTTSKASTTTAAKEKTTTPKSSSKKSKTNEDAIRERAYFISLHSSDSPDVNWHRAEQELNG